MFDAQSLGCSFKTQTRQARWDSEGWLKKTNPSQYFNIKMT